MDTTPAPFFRTPGAGQVLDVLGTTHIYKATAAETGGAFSLWEAVIPPGGGAPPHTHAHEDESFYVLSGELLVELEGDAAPHRVAPGGFFFGARGRRYAFRNVGDQPAHVLILSTPSVGLDRMFAEMDSVTASGAPDFRALAALTARYGVALEPPARADATA